MKRKQIITWVIVLIIVGSLSFYAGTTVGRNKGGSNGAGGQFTAGGAGGSRMGRGGVNGGGGFITGEVISKDSTSVTVKLKDGGSKIIFIASSTAVQKTSSGTLDDIVVGSQASANGSTNADGSINAVTISSRPIPPQGQGGGQNGPTGGAGGPAGQPAR